MTDRQKFWLKVVLAVTFPLWALPALIAAAMFVLGLCVWECVSDIVEPRKSCGLGGGR